MQFFLFVRIFLKMKFLKNSEKFTQVYKKLSKAVHIRQAHE